MTAESEGAIKRKATKRKRSLIRRIFDACMALVVLGMVFWVVLFFAFAPELPDTDALWEEKPSPGLTVIGADGRKLIHRASFNGLSVRLAKLPDHLPQAVIATEDRRFYEHFGLDVLGLLRAIISNVKAGGVVQGGSTITQQLAKNLYLSHERKLLRKIREMFLAIWLETRLSKEQILELYLNRVYLGAGAYGMEAAAQRYFAKSASAVTLPEAAMLAGLLKAPSRYAPTNDLARARSRAGQVLSAMTAAGYLTEAQAAAAREAPAKLARSSSINSANYFVDWIAEDLEARVSSAEQDLGVVTTLDSGLQGAAERILREALSRDGPALRVGQGAIVALGPDGAVRAMVGGRSYAASQFNRAAQARRQPGSAFKPVIFLTALEAGLTPDTQVEDKPIRLDGWQPRNWNDKYLGRITLRTALARSVNSAAVRLQERVGRDKVIETARRIGIESDLRPEPSLALGPFEVTPLEITAAYAPFANQGRQVRPYGVVAVYNAEGRPLYRRRDESRPRVIAARQLEQMRDLLGAVVRDGTGRAAKPKRGRAIGKTGTTQDARDGWFIGSSGDLTIGVWIGNDDGSATRGLSGGGLPARIWKALVDWRNSTPGAKPQVPLPLPKPQQPDGSNFVQRMVDWAFGTLEESWEDVPIDKETAKDATNDFIDWIKEEMAKARETEYPSGKDHRHRNRDRDR